VDGKDVGKGGRLRRGVQVRNEDARDRIKGEEGRSLGEDILWEQAVLRRIILEVQ